MRELIWGRVGRVAKAEAEPAEGGNGGGGKAALPPLQLPLGLPDGRATIRVEAETTQLGVSVLTVVVAGEELTVWPLETGTNLLSSVMEPR